MRFVDDKSKNVNWWNRNYGYIGTVLFILFNVIIFVSNYHFEIQEVRVWSEFDLTNIFIAVTNVFEHGSVDHIMHNSLMIIVGGLYVERKTGSLKFLLLILAFSFMGALATSVCAGSLAWRGSSVVWFALWGYILIDYLFSFQKNKRNKTNIILGAVILVIEYLRSGFYDKIGGGIGWTVEPYQLIYNAGHYSGFIVGMIFALTVCLSQIGGYKKEQ